MDQRDEKLSTAYKVKEFYCQTTLKALGTAFELVSKWDPELQDEIADWEENLVFSMGILPNGPYMTAQREGRRVRYLGLGEKNPSVSILFKNMDSALMSFTGQIGTPGLAAQRRFLVKGSVSESIKVARGLEIVQKFLFPSIILNKIFKNPPRYSYEQLLTKAKVYAAIGPAIAMNYSK
jgi:hypothetical protein